MLKRKELDDLDDFHPCFSSRKSRRLDGNSLLPVIKEEATAIVEQVHYELDSKNTCVDQSDGILSSEDRAIVPYDGIATRFFKSPSQPGFTTIVIDSNLIPGLKDRLSVPSYLKRLSDAENDQSSITSNDYMAMVPWVASTSLSTSETKTQESVVSEPMEADNYEPQMMDTDEIPDNDAGAGIAFELDTNRGFPMWQHQNQPQQNFLSPCFGNY